MMVRLPYTNALLSAVGLAAVQIAKALGAKVIATAGSAAKLDVAKQFGADYGINYTKEGWQKEVMKITEGHGVDVCVRPCARCSWATADLNTTHTVCTTRSA